MLMLLDTLGTLITAFSQLYRQAMLYSAAFVLVFAMSDDDSLTELYR